MLNQSPEEDNSSNILESGDVFKSFLRYALFKTQSAETEFIPIVVKDLCQLGQFKQSADYLQFAPKKPLGVSFAIMYCIAHQSQVSEEDKVLYQEQCNMLI